VFSAETGAPLPAAGFVAESPAFRLTLSDQHVAADHPVEPRRRPLVGLPAFAELSYILSWLDEQHAILDSGEQVLLDLSRGRVVRSGRDLFKPSTRDDELLSCENGRFERVRRSDGARLGGVPLSGCPITLAPLGPYFSYSDNAGVVIAEPSTGRAVATFKGLFLGWSAGTHSVAFGTSVGADRFCGRFDYGAESVSPMLLLPQQGPAPERCLAAADAVVAEWLRVGSTKASRLSAPPPPPARRASVWRPSSQRYVDGRGRESKQAVDFCSGALLSNEAGLGCVDAGTERTRLALYDGRAVSAELAGHVTESELAPDGHALAAVTDDGVFYLLSSALAGVARIPLEPARAGAVPARAFKPSRLVFSPNSEAVAVETKLEDGAGPAFLVRLSPTPSAIELRPAAVKTVSFAPSGKRLIAFAERTFVFDLESSKLEAWGDAANPYATHFHADERTLFLPLKSRAPQGISQIVRDGTPTAVGQVLDQDEEYVLLHTDSGAVELWTTSGERRGLLPAAMTRLPVLSPSGKLGLWRHDNALEIVRVGSEETLRVHVLPAFGRYYSVLQASDGRFVGDEPALAALRFASGSSWLSAVPLTGLEVRGRFEAATLFSDFGQGPSLHAPGAPK